MSLIKNDVSIVIPVLDEQESIAELYNWIKKVLEISNLQAELIFVDDGSIDDSWKEISKLAIIVMAAPWGGGGSNCQAISQKAGQLIANIIAA